MSALDNMENVFGKISKDIRVRVSNYLNNPTVDNWDDISSIIINDNFKTLWNAVIEIKPSFPRQGRVYDMDDNIVREWSEIPSPFEVMRAIKESQ